jgi:hypothetical protein
MTGQMRDGLTEELVAVGALSHEHTPAWQSPALPAPTIGTHFPREGIPVGWLLVRHTDARTEARDG